MSEEEEEEEEDLTASFLDVSSPVTGSPMDVFMSSVVELMPSSTWQVSLLLSIHAGFVLCVYIFEHVLKRCEYAIRWVFSYIFYEIVVETMHCEATCM